MPYEPNRLYTLYEITESPETGEDVPVVVSWWYHPDPDSPEAQAGAAGYRRFIRHTRMHEHMAHWLENTDGKETYLSLTGQRGRMRNHPLDEALDEPVEMPVPDPVPASLGHAIVHADMGVYALLADPQQHKPTLQTALHQVSNDPGSVGMARFAIRANDQARKRYASSPLEKYQVSEELRKRVMSEPDPSLRSGLMFLWGIPRPGQEPN